MGLLQRKPRPLARVEMTYRDDRLFIVATEDTYAPEQYFKLMRQPRIHILVLPTPKDSGLSAPEHVVRRLEASREEFDLGEDDQLWVLLDTDHWIEDNHRPGLLTALTQAQQQKFKIAMSNPCFDLWLLLHHETVAKGEMDP